MQLLAAPYGNWLEEGGYARDEALLEKGSGRMPSSARTTGWPWARRKPWEPPDVPFFGVDALPDAGLQDVIDGRLTASYLYPTRGDLVMELAMKILAGKPFRRETILESALVDSHNAGILKMQEAEVSTQRSMVEDMNGKLDRFLLQYNNQRLMMWLVIGFALLLMMIAAQAYWSYVKTRELQRKLEETTAAKLAFFTQVSHDLRTPLSLVVGPLEHVLEGPLSPQQKQTPPDGQPQCGCPAAIGEQHPGFQKDRKRQYAAGSVPLQFPCRREGMDERFSAAPPGPSVMKGKTR